MVKSTLSSDYRKGLGKKVKDMSEEENKEYVKLRQRDSRANRKQGIARPKKEDKPKDKKMVDKKKVDKPAEPIDKKIIKKATKKESIDKGTHKMPDGTVMSGKTHNKDSKPVNKKKQSLLKAIKDIKAKRKPAKKKPAKKVGKLPKVGKGGTNKGNIKNDKLKCFMLTASNGGKYRTCATRKGMPKNPPREQVRDKPRPKVPKSPPRVKRYIRAYKDAKARRKAQYDRDKADGKFDKKKKK